jgi:zinc transport system substrate-binding protein
MKANRACPAIAAILFVLTASTPASASDRVVASIKPIHSLVAAIMGDTGTPSLIIRGGTSPHSYSLKPSVAKRIGKASLIFWVGEGLESTLAKPFRALGRKARIVTLSRSPGLSRVKFREGGLFESHAADDTALQHGDDHGEHEIDNHFWLDPANAKIFATEIEKSLIAANPGNAAKYKNNARALRAGLDALMIEIEHRLRLVKGRPFIVFHDAYHYFERRFGIPAAGSIVVNPDRKPGARRLSSIRRKIKSLGAVCVFSEPQFTPALVTVLTDDTGARTGILDPIGADLTAGPALYYRLMRNMTTSFVNCLGSQPAKP